MTSAANSIQRDVEPGCKTGIYYITIANLPFGTSWHALKDWLRHTCIVEHVEIFNSSTSGWARFRGEENFLRALAHFDHCEFGGRCIIADGRNATERIKIKELIVEPTRPKKKLTHLPPIPRASPAAVYSYGAARNPAPSPMTSSYQGQWPASSPPVGPPYSPYPGVASPAPSHAEPATDRYYFPTMSDLDYSEVGETGPYEGDAEGDTQLPTPPYDYPVQQQQYQQQQQQYPVYDGPLYSGETAAMAAAPELYSSSMTPGGLLATERRKIIVKHLGQSSSEDQLRRLIKTSLKTVTEDKHQLQHIEFPRDADGRLRGHIFATFKTPAAARGVVKDLHGQSYLRRVLDVRLANEGIAKNPQLDRHQYEEWDKPPRNDRKDAAATKGKSKSKTGKGRGCVDRARSPPIIANGSSRASSSPDRPRRRDA